jgi:hypothetical protein
MQDGQFSNTPFQEQLANSNYRAPNKPSLQVFAESGTEPETTDPALLLQQFQNRINNKPDSKLGAQSPVTFSPSEVDVTGRYNWQRIGGDNEDLYAQGQSWGDKALNGLLKGLNLAGTTFLQGTVGLVAGLGNVIAGNGANSFYNNDFSNTIESWNKRTENYLPNYYTKKERDSKWYEGSNLFTANFLFDKFVKNLGFSLGAIYSGAAVTKALKLVPAINSLFTGEKALATLSQIENKISLVPATERTLEMANTIRQASDAVNKAVKFGTQAERFVVGTLGAATEGGIEALQGLNDYRNNLIDQYTASTGVAPQGDALDKINSYAENLGDARFLMNMALLTATNYVMLPKILGSSYKTSKGLANQEVNAVAKNAEGQWVSRFSQASKPVKLLSKAKNIAGLFFSPTEGFEEISQYAVERGVQDYYNKAYRGEGRDWVSSIGQGYYDAIHSDEGMEQFLIGALSGGLQQAGIVSTKGFGKSGNIKERGWTGQGGERQRNTESFISGLNDPKNQVKFKSESWLKDMSDAAARGINLQQEGESYIRQGDVLEAKDNEADYMHNYLAVRIKHGRFDLVKEDIDNYTQQASTPDGLEGLKQQNIANENDTQATFLQRMQNFSRHAENVDSLYKSLNLTYGGIVNKETKERIYTDAVIDKMVYAASKIADYDQRIPEISKELMSRGVVIQPSIIDAVSTAPTGESIKEAIKQIDELPIIDTTKDELKESLRDVLELSSRRKGFLEEYKSLKTNPTAFQETQKPTETSAITPKEKIVLKTKDGDEELEIGTEYYLGSVTEKDKDGNDVYRFPQITILGENEDGTIKIKSSTGVIKDVSKSVLEDYKLGRVDDLQNNKKAKFYFDHINDVFEFNFGKGKKQRGRLQFSPKKDVLNFVYKDKNGKTRFIEVTGDQFVPKKGFTEPMIKSIRTLTPAQQKSLEDMAAEKDARIQAKREARIGIVTSLINDAYNRLQSINSKLKDKYSDLESIEKKLSDIELKIRRGELTKKQNFKATTKAAIRQANILSGMRNVIVDEIRELETEQEETEFNITYFEDLGSNIDELPTDSKEFLEEINDQVLDLTILHEETGKQINSLASILTNVEKALKNSVDFALSLIKKFESKYPGLPVAPAALQQFLNKDLEFKGTWPDYQSYLSANPNLLDDLREFDRELAEIDELDVIPNERSIEELRNDIKELQDKLSQYDKEIAAKQAILDKFDQIAKEYKAKEEAKKRYAADKALHDTLFKAQSSIQQEPVDDTNPDGIEKLEKADREATKKQDLATYPVSTAFTTREIDPTFESKPHLLREESFLNNYSAGNLTDDKGNDITPEVRVLVVHKGNQAALGLNGLVEQRNPNEATQDSTILYVYIKKGQGVFEIIDETGKTIGEYDADFTAKSPIDLNSVVTSVAKTSSSISQKADNYTNKSSLDAKAVEKAWEEERAKLLKSENTVLSIRGVSRGIKQITNTSDKNPVVPTLTKEAKPGMIKVSTTDVIATPNQSVFYKAGRAYLQIGDNITFLNGRNLNKQEADAIFLVLKEVATKFQESIKNDQPQLDKPLVDWLNSMIYWYSPKAGQKPHNQQIYIKNGTLHISGVDTEIYFTPEQLEDNRDPIINTFLEGNQAGQGTYHHISHKALTEEGPYISYYTEDGKTLKTKSYPSYQDYLLENSVVSTNVRPQISPTDSNIRGRYAIMDIDLNIPQPEKKAPASKPATKPTAQPTSGRKKNMWDEISASLDGEEQEKQEEETSSPTPKQEKKAAPTSGRKPNAWDAISDSFVEADDKLNDLKSQGFNADDVTNDDEEEYRRLSERDLNNTTIENWSAVEAWLSKNLPNVPVQRVKHLLQTTDGGWAWGKFGKAGITLYENAKEGTGYHEAFEAVWALFTTLEEKQNTLLDLRKRKGKFFDVISGQMTDYSAASDSALKELLADEFAAYVQNEGKPSEKTKGQFWITRLFRGLYDFLKGLFNPSQKNINTLFENINTGYYSTRPVNIPSSTQDAFSRLPSLTHQLTKELMEDVTSRILNNFFGEKATLSLANLADNKAIPIGEFYAQMKAPLINRLLRMAEEAKKEGNAEAFTSWVDLASNINQNWNSVVALNEQYLKTFGIAKVETGDNVPQEDTTKPITDTSFDEDEQLNEESDQTFEADNKSQLEYDRDIFTISGKANASAGIRLLLSTLRDGHAIRQDANDPSVLPKLQLSRSSIGGFKFLPYARVFNQLANALVNTNKIENILNKLVKHGKHNAPIIDLIKKLKINTTTGKINYSALSYDEWRILLDFTKTMSKQNPSAYIYVNQGGTSQFIPGDKRSGVEQIKNAFVRNVKRNNELFIYEGKSKSYKVNPEFFKKHPAITKEEDYIKFVNALGIKDVEGESISLAIYKTLSPKEKSQFKAAVNQLYTQLKKQQPIFDTTTKSLQFATPLNTIAGSIISMSRDDGVNTFLNILRKPVQTVVLNNPLSTFFNNFNNIDTIDDLSQEEKGLLEGFSQGSIILQLGGRFFDKDGYRTDERIDVGYFDGAKNVKGARQSSKLSLINRRLNTFNLNLRGWFVPITNGDKKTEWMLSMGNNISYKEIASTNAWGRVYSIFQNYLQTEMNVAQTDDGKNLQALKKQGRAGNLRFFLDILPEKLASKARQSIEELEDPQEFIQANIEAINKATKIFMEREANKTKSEFTQYGVIQPIGETELYSFDGIDDSFIYSNINDNGANRFNKEQIDNTILYRTINQVINNIEIHKLLIGDPAFMTDPAKRIPGAMGGVNQSVYGSPEFNSHFSTLLNRVNVKDSSTAVLPTDYGYTVLSEDVPMALYNDVEVAGRVEGNSYKGVNETDGASKITLPAYRELKTRSAEWTDQQETQYQYQMAFFRDRASKQFGYKYSSKELAKHDQDLLSKPRPEEGVFEILKPKGWGQNSSSNYRDIVYLKTSTQPLIPTAIIGTNDEKLAKKMMDEGVKIAAFESAIKTGIRTLSPFYVDGVFNNKPYPKDGILRPTWKDLGIQVETQFSQGKTTLTFGSQLSTLSCLNLLSSGVPEGFTPDQWNKLSEEEKIAQSPSYKEVRRNDNILRALTNNGYNTLLKKLGVEETAEGYNVSDYQKVINYLVEQSRDMDDNTRAALKIDQLTGQLATPLEAIPTYTSLKAVLYSIVDKNIASPKTSGAGLVQMPSTGTESEARTTLVGNSTYKFYTKEEPWIEVSLPAWFRDKLVEFYTKRNLPIPSEQELLSLINDTNILEGIGFRIPTQELNSAEVFRIKSFLPRVMGNTVIVPSEITKKAGSDFDIDKLSTYLKNIIITKDGRLDKLKSFENDAQASEYFGKEFETRLQESKKSLEKAKKAVAFKQSKAQDYAEGLLSEEQIDKYSDLLDEIFEDFNTPQEAGEYFMTLLEGMGAREKRLSDTELQMTLKGEYINRNIRKSLENAYYESLQSLLQLPENFDRLIAINTTKDLEDIKNTLNKALFTEKEIKDLNINTGEKPALSYLSILSPNSLDEIRHNLITGKDGVGIAAAAQKSNSVMQRLPVTLDASRMTLLEDIDPLRVQYMGDGVVRFPHNRANGLPTISAKKTKGKKNYISDIISQYINGFVDIVKNTFIIEMGINTRTAGTFLFMDRLGNDTEHTTYFMNQPIIREYLKLLDRAGINGIRSKLMAQEVMERWGAEAYKDSEQLPTVKQLLDNIKEYRDKNRDFNNLSPQFIGEQARIFSEFMKYQEMGGDLFTLMQGVNWDTAHMSDPEQFLLKDMKYWKANNTIFTPASEILSNVFIGGVRTNLLKSRDAIGEFIAIEHPRVRATLDELKRKFISLSFMPSADDYGKTASRINNSFINYILQLKGKMSEKTLTNILLDEATSAANLLEKIKASTPKDSDLYPILKRFSVERRGTTDNSVKAILLRKSGNDKYDRDSDIDALRILKENAHTAALYGKLVRASLLQSGAQYTPISFSNLIPNEDYAAALSDPIKGLPFYTDLDNFLTSNAFVRNSWATNGVVPNATLSKKQVIDRRDEGGNLWAAPFSLPKPLGNMPSGSIYTSIQYKGEYIKYQPINAEGAFKYVPGEHKLLSVKMALQNGDPTIFKTFLYEIVRDDTGKPLTITSKSKNGDLEVYVYKAINAWGDGMYAQEYYDSPRSSQIDNNTFRVDENIVNDATILKALGRVAPSFEDFKKNLPKKDCN